MNEDRAPVSAEVDRTKHQERAEQILTAAADLLLRYGYKRVTIEDIAHAVGIGKGTIYLHWKTREALFGTLILREVVAIWRELLQRVRADPSEVLFHRVMRSLMLIGMQRPLARALLSGDRERLGKLVRSGLGGAMQAQQAILREEALALLRSQGLLRADTDLATQRYALRATVTGFLILERSLTNEDQLPLETKAEALAQTVRRAFEPEELPPLAALPDIATRMIEWLEQLCAAFEQQIREQMEG